jgi:acyl-coenzyme A thioesterase PaaI-like protein
MHVWNWRKYLFPTNNPRKTVNGPKEVTTSISTQNGHGGCIMCGDQNPWSLKLNFLDDGEDAVRASFQSPLHLQGYDGILHGGVTSALLDSAMTHCLFHHGIQAVTGDLHVRFLLPVPCPSRLELKARMLSFKSPLYRLRGELIHEDRVLAYAEAKFLKRGYRQ